VAGRTPEITVWLDRPASTAAGALGTLAQKLGTSKLPETYLVDAEGNVRYWFVNTRDWGSLEARACVESLIAR
ncbi:MAG: hypothetical protein IT373_28470, partial [Polyangiaceae bacterium]|nr:hypothetical protein [Polyangiaceae bacterium]